MVSIGQKNREAIADPASDHRLPHTTQEKLALVKDMKLPDIIVATKDDIDKAWNKGMVPKVVAGDIVSNVGEEDYRRRLAKEARLQKANRKTMTADIAIPVKRTTHGKKNVKSKEVVDEEDEAQAEMPMQVQAVRHMDAEMSSPDDGTSVQPMDTDCKCTNSLCCTI
jgi:hypothetical protein